MTDMIAKPLRPSSDPYTVYESIRRLTGGGWAATVQAVLGEITMSDDKDMVRYANGLLELFAYHNIRLSEMTVMGGKMPTLHEAMDEINNLAKQLMDEKVERDTERRIGEK
jgi:hypothetical protein